MLRAPGPLAPAAAGLGLWIVLCTLAPVPRAGAQETPRLRVFAAASLTEVARELVAGFEGARVELSLGSSSALARQIRDGAPADVFLSASPDWIDFLDEAGRLAGEPLVLARNRLACITAPGSRLALARDGVSDAPALLAALGPGDRLAIADPGVPAGEYARSALASLGLLEAYAPRLVGQRDVRAVLHAVEQGELLAGFTYATDAKIGDVEVLFLFDPATHPPIEYRAAVLRDASQPALARRFVAVLQGPSAHEALRAAGFTPGER